MILLYTAMGVALLPAILVSVHLLVGRPKPDTLLEVSPPCCGGPSVRDHIHRHAAGCPYGMAV